MEWPDWEPHYLEILQDFGFDRRRDEEAARILSELLPTPRASAHDVEKRLQDRVVTVLGNGPNLQDELAGVQGQIVAADEATSVALHGGIRPDVIVTDLDGRVEDQIEAQRLGALAVVHAHGDNIDALRQWVPSFAPLTVGTTQAEPIAGIHNFGGFTDGDRAVFLADHFRAREIRMAGFDFERPNPKDRPTETKLRKLAWARRLLEDLGRRRPIIDPSSASSG